MSQRVTNPRPYQNLWLVLLGAVFLLLLGLGILFLQASRSTYTPTVLPAGDFRIDMERAASTLLGFVQEDTSNPPLYPESFALARERIINLIEREYVQPLGLEVRRKDPSYLTILRASGSTRDAVVLLSYADLPSVDASTWRCDPKGERRADVLCGLGIRYGKGKLLTDLEAIAALKRSGLPLPFHVVVATVFDAQQNGDKSIKELLSASGLLSDMKIRVVIDSSRFSSKSFSEKLLPVAVTEKRSLWLRLVAEGSSEDDPLAQSEQAASRMISALQQLLAWNKGGTQLGALVQEFALRTGDTLGFPGKLLYKNPGLLNPLLRSALSKDAATQAMTQASLSIEALSAAQENSLLPRLAETRVAVRLLPEQDPNSFLGELRQILAKYRVQLEVLRMNPPAVEASFDAPFFKAIESAAKRVFPQQVIVPVIQPESSLGSAFAYVGIPVLRIPAPKNAASDAEEAVNLTSLRDQIEFTYQLLYGASLREGDPFVDLVSRRY